MAHSFRPGDLQLSGRIRGVTETFLGQMRIGVDRDSVMGIECTPFAGRGVDSPTFSGCPKKRFAKRKPFEYTRALSAGVAQQVERLICNQRVGGSIPSASSTLSSFARGARTSGGTPRNLGRYPSWPKGADCKSVGSCLRRFESSSPHHVLLTGAVGHTAGFRDRRAPNVAWHVSSRVPTREE
jgi:hypothetical protein